MEDWVKLLNRMKRKPEVDTKKAHTERSNRSIEGDASKQRFFAKVFGVCLVLALCLSVQGAARDILLNVPLLSQNDPQWRNEQLGTCRGTYLGYPNPANKANAAAGCAVTSLAMVYNYYHPGYTDPGKLNVALRIKGGYAGTYPDLCLLYWSKLNSIGVNAPNVRYQDYLPSERENDFFANIDRELANGDPVIACVRCSLTDMHFVAIVGKDRLGNYIINDPWGGVRCTLDKSPFRGHPPYELKSLILFDRTTTSQPYPSPSPLPPTATVLVMDVSGSMGWSWKGGIKIESAKKAALEFIEEVTHEAETRGGQHKIGVVAFSDGARLLLPLTSDYNRARQVIISLSATNATNLGAGLSTALAELGKVPNTAQRFVILLSDGETNTGLSRDQILSGPVLEALQRRICIHTVAFGDPGDIDETFLRKIAVGSGCGTYNYASTPFQLFATYLKLRHRSLGQVVGEYSSLGKNVTILPGVPITLGTVIIGSGKRELHYTLAWSESGQLQIRLKDPSGRLVTASYPGAYIYTAEQFTHLTLLSPKPGVWTVEAAAGTSMPNGTEYYAILSTRPGGIAIPLPLPIFTVGNRTFALPAGLPTWLLVTISVLLIALVLYQEFGK